LSYENEFNLNVKFKRVNFDIVALKTGKIQYFMYNLLSGIFCISFLNISPFSDSR